MCHTCTLPTLTPTNPHPRRPACRVLLPAVYDHTTLAVNIKNKHMGRTEGAGAGEEQEAQVMFHKLFLLMPQVQKPGNVTCISSFHLRTHLLSPRIVSCKRPYSVSCPSLLSLTPTAWNIYLPPTGESHRDSIWQAPLSPVLGLTKASILFSVGPHSPELSK